MFEKLVTKDNIQDCKELSHLWNPNKALEAKSQLPHHELKEMAKLRYSSCYKDLLEAIS
jgi:hypothetical protein